MSKIKLVGWSKEPIEIAELDVMVSMEGFVFLRMRDEAGHEYETGLLKETS